MLSLQCLRLLAGRVLAGQELNREDRGQRGCGAGVNRDTGGREGFF